MTDRADHSGALTIRRAGVATPAADASAYFVNGHAPDCWRRLYAARAYAAAQRHAATGKRLLPARV